MKNESVEYSQPRNRFYLMNQTNNIKGINMTRFIPKFLTFNTTFNLWSYLGTKQDLLSNTGT